MSTTAAPQQPPESEKSLSRPAVPNGSLPSGSKASIDGLGNQSIENTSVAAASAMAREQHEIQCALLYAGSRPRNEDVAFMKLMKAAARTSFAEDAAYKFPRGGQDVTGPSVNIAREAARVWGNIRHGVDVIEDNQESRKIRGWAWDMETNVKVTADDEFAKLIQRKEKTADGKPTGRTVWVTPDERDLRELQNRRGAILKRNCILELLPRDLIDDALDKCASTLMSDAEKDPDLARKRVMAVFAEINISLDTLEEQLGHPLAECTPKELADLRQVGVSIRDGHSTWKQYVEAGVEKPGPATANLDAFKAGDATTHMAVDQPVGKPAAAGAFDPKTLDDFATIVRSSDSLDMVKENWRLLTPFMTRLKPAEKAALQKVKDETEVKFGQQGKLI